MSENFGSSNFINTSSNTVNCQKRVQGFIDHWNIVPGMEQCGYLLSDLYRWYKEWEAGNGREPLMYNGFTKQILTQLNLRKRCLPVGGSRKTVAIGLLVSGKETVDIKASENDLAPAMAAQERFPIIIDFQGYQLKTMLDEITGKPVATIKPICDAMGLDHNAQRKLILRSPVLNSVCSLRTSTGKDGKNYEMLCLPIDYIPGWLFKIHPNRYPEEMREVIILFQHGCHQALAEYWFGGPKKITPGNPPKFEDVNKPAAAGRGQRRFV